MIATLTLADGRTTVVDEADLPLLVEHAWFGGGSKRQYACTTVTIGGRRTTKKLHQFLLELSPDEEGDHINGDTLDNRRENLRAVTHSQNAQNQRRLKKQQESRSR